MQTPTELALDILAQEFRQAKIVYDSLRNAKINELKDGISVADFIENSATLIRRETAFEFYKIVIDEVTFMLEKGKTVVQALDESYHDRLEDCLYRGRSAYNCTCAMTNASKGIKLTAISQLISDYRSIINYIKKEIGVQQKEFLDK